MKNQAQFHPLLYLKTLLEKFVEMGGKVYEQTTAMDVEKGDYSQIITKRAIISLVNMSSLVHIFLL